jgi:hypothetical protein
LRNNFAMLLIALVLASLAISTTAIAAEIFPPGTTGYDLSWPQCSVSAPAKPLTFVIIGATGGKAFTHNPCLAGQYAWAAASGRQPSLYMNLKSPVGSSAEEALSGPKGVCRPDDQACQAYNFGYKTAQDAVAYATSLHASAASWWLDVETTSSWSGDTAMNAVVIGAAIDFLKAQGATVGIYSSQSQWGEIAGSYRPGLPVWVSAAPSPAAAPSYCSRAFGGGQVLLVQYMSGIDDVNYACTTADWLAAVESVPLGSSGSRATVAIDSDCLNVRAQAGFAGSASTCLAAGTQVTLLDGSVLADGYRWQLVSLGSITGWVASNYLRGVAASVGAADARGSTGKIMAGSIPPVGGFGLIVFGGGTNAELLAASGCPAERAAFWATNAAGDFDVYAPGTAIALVNAAWNARFGTGIPPATPLLGRCR